MVVAGGTFFALAISRSYFEVGGLPNGLVGVIEPIALSVSILGHPLSHSVRAQYKRGFMRLWLGRGRLPMAQARDWETRAHPRRRRTAAQPRSFASCLRRRIPRARRAPAQPARTPRAAFVCRAGASPELRQAPHSGRPAAC